MVRRLSWWLLVGASAALLVVSMLVAVAVGPADLSVGEVVRSVLAHLGLGTAPPRLDDAIVWELRLPRVLTAAAVGGGLAVAGAVMQSLTRNPLADPYLLGLSSGASLGAVAVLLLGVGVLLPVAAFAGAMLALVATLALARSSGGGLSAGRTVLAGLAVSQLAAAATSLVVFWTATGDSYREILSWLLGSLAGSTWASVGIAAGAVVVVGAVLAGWAGRLDAFAFGDQAAAALGVDPDRTRWWVLGAVALLTGALVSVSGSIGFVGLMVPHAVVGLTGPAHRRLLPIAGLAGAVLLVWADTVARTAFDPRELPVGIVTALLGAPVLAVLLRRGRGSAWT
jgi:iron complex transport system permease protein